MRATAWRLSRSVPSLDGTLSGSRRCPEQGGSGGAWLGVLRHLPAELQGDLAETIQGLDTDSPLSTPEESLDDLVACVAEIAEVTRGFTIKE